MTITMTVILVDTEPFIESYSLRQSPSKPGWGIESMWYKSNKKETWKYKA